MPQTIEPIWIEPWTDDVIDPLGHDPKSPYVERFWLGILGPSATWLLRSISYGFDAAPTGFNLSQTDTARVLGLGDRTGKYSPLQRSITRLCTFEFGYFRGETLVVRSRVPWLEPRQVSRLSGALQDEHRLWEDAEYQTSANNARKRRAASTAMGTYRSGGNTADVLRVLARMNTEPGFAQEIAVWASQTIDLIARVSEQAKAG
jgi:hypothetical protein